MPGADHRCARAPTRLDFAGGWTDVPPFSTREGGAVVNAAIELYVHAEVTRRKEGVRFEATDLGATFEADAIPDLEPSDPLILLKAAARRCYGASGVSVRTSAETPLGSGLGSSGALDVALVAAFAALTNAALPPAQVAELGWRIETGDCGFPGGRQDQYAAALGGVHLFTFEDPAVGITALELPADVRTEIERRLVLCYVGQTRVSGKTIARVMTAYARGQANVVRALHELKAIALEMADVLPTGDLDRFGRLLSHNWENQMALDDRIVTPAMAALVREVEKTGILGGKAAGAGAGGSMFFLCRDNPEDVRRAAMAAGATVLPVRFADNGVAPC